LLKAIEKGSITMNPITVPQLKTPRTNVRNFLVVILGKVGTQAKGPVYGFAKDMAYIPAHSESLGRILLLEDRD